MPRTHRPTYRGFTLMEILVAIVVVGVLATVVILGVTSLTSKSSSAACTASRDAAAAAVQVHYTNTGRFPTALSDLTNATPPELQLPSGVTLDGTGTVATGNGWSLTITPGVTGVAPTFTCAALAGGAGASGTTTTAAGATTTTTAANGTSACPGTFGGWVGEYYNNTGLSGSAVLCRDDASVNFNWGSGSPAAAVHSDNFSVRWTRTVSFTNGNHVFTIGSDDGARLYIDGSRVFDNWRDQSYRTSTVTRGLSAGNHVVVMEFYEHGGSARATLSWT